ncbi:MAG TPA: hypothetical protein VMU83_22490 [Hanamia sp.]|nr:hypothetical protein [Hanamia sp.]
MIPNSLIQSKNEIILSDNSKFFYSIRPFEMTNILGHVVAILQEYTFVKIDDSNNELSYKLYRTKEGNWYEINSELPTLENNILS